MFRKIMDAVRQWCTANKLGLLGFAIGMVCVLAVAGLYRISWEFPETSPDLNTSIPAPKASVTPTPAPASQTRTPVPQKATRAKPVLQRLDGPPEPLRNLHEQQNKPETR